MSYSYKTRLAITVDAVPYYMGTEDELVGSDWHEGVLERDQGIQERFLYAGINRGSTVSVKVLRHDDQASAQVFADYLAGDFTTGGSAKLTVVQTDEDGNTTTKARWLTVREIRLQPGALELRLADTADEALASLHPGTTWEDTGRFPSMREEDLKALVPYPIGTCLKLTGREIFPNSLATAVGTVPWQQTRVFALCETPTQRATISSSNDGTETITLTGDYTAKLKTGDTFYSWVNGSQAQLHGWTASSVTLNGGNTDVVVAEGFTGSWTGDIIWASQALAVYRNGRLVDPSEYVVRFTDSYSANRQLDSTEFTSVGTWVTSTGGTGTANINTGAGKAELSGDGGPTNFGAVVYLDNGGAPPDADNVVRGATMVMKVVVLSGRVAIADQAQAAASVVVGPGTHYLPLIRNRVTPWWTLSTQNAGNNGSAEIDSFEVFGLDGLSGTQKPVPPVHLVVEFKQEQIDFNGGRYTIQADVVNRITSRNAVDEIDRVLGFAGVSLDATSKATAVSYATTHKMEIDYAHGWDNRARTVRAIVDDLLFIARATLRRSDASATEYVIAQDKDAAASQTFDEDLGDPVDVDSLDMGARPSSVSISYRPSGFNPGQLVHTVERTVTGGTLGPEKPRPVPMVRDHETADRLLCYLARRSEYDRTVSGRLFGKAVEIGDVIALESVQVLPTGGKYLVDSTGLEGDAVGFTAIETAAYVETYAAGTLPSDAVEGYAPDYSLTPPAAPTVLKILSQSINVGTVTGESQSAIVASAVPPTVNWESVWFVAIHNTTGEIPAIVQGARSTTDAAGAYTATLTGLRPGEVYKLQAFARNGNNLDGAVVSTFDATAIGGGATDTTFTAAGTPSAPADVTGISRDQGPGKSIRVTWNSVSASNLQGYVLQRDGAEIWRGRATAFVDHSVSYGVSYTYRVKAINTAGVLSANWNTASALSINGNLLGGAVGTADIGQGTVSTGNRTAVNTTSSNGTIATSAAKNEINFAHGLGKVPTVAAWISSYTGTEDAWGFASKISTTLIYFEAHRNYQLSSNPNSYEADTLPYNYTVIYW